MKGIFEARAESPYNLHKFYEIGSISFLGQNIWSLLPENSKNIDSLVKFKILIKRGKPKNCPCRLFKVSMKNVVFL